jgi:Family of unknown function (DUF6152)
MKLIEHLAACRPFGRLGLAGIGITLAFAAFAHHSQSEFDPQLRVTIEGRVGKLDWRSPHARLLVDAVDENGDAVVWDFELPSPTTLMRRGWSRKSLLPGDPVTVTGFRARNYPTIAIARTVRDRDGNAVFTGATPVNGVIEAD